MTDWKTISIAIATTAVVAVTQTPPPQFEVASVKPNKSGDNRVGISMQPGGRFAATGVTLRMLIGIAYGTPQPLPNSQMIGGPKWIASDRFDIVAKAEGDFQPGPEGRNLLLRALLADRFKLAVHNESRELPIYALVKSRSDGKLGSQLSPATVDCAALAVARGRGAAPTPPESGDGAGGPGRGAAARGGPGGPAGPGFDAGGRPVCGTMIGPANIAAGGQTIAQLATLLSGRLGRPVVDRTGLTGAFDITLTWTPDQIAQGQSGPPPPGAPPLPPIDPNGPSIFTAVREQLGLRLESTKGPVDVLVIDRAEHPTAD